MDPIQATKSFKLFYGFVLDDLEDQLTQYPLLFFPAVLCIRAQRLMLS